MIIDLFDNHQHHGNFYDLIIMFVTIYSDEIFCMIWSSQDFVLKQSGADKSFFSRFLFIVGLFGRGESF